MTDAQICSVALGKLGVPGIISLDDDTDQARACKAVYEMLRDAVLEARVWTFALQQFVLQPHPVAPEFGYTARYEIPSLVARVFRVWNYQGALVNWVRQGRFILTSLDVVATQGSAGAELPAGLPVNLGPDVDPATCLLVLAVVREPDTSLYSPAFTAALATRIAAELAVPLTENARLQADLWALYENQVREAAGTDGSQGTQERITGSWLKRRRG